MKKDQVFVKGVGLVERKEDTQQIEPELLQEFEEALTQVKDFDICKLRLSQEDNEVLEIFFKKFLDPKEEFPSGSRHSIIEKNLAIYILSNGISPDSEEYQKVKDAYASKGYNLSSLVSQLKGVENGSYGEDPSVNIGELVNWCKSNRPDLVELFKTNDSLNNNSWVIYQCAKCGDKIKGIPQKKIFT